MDGISTVFIENPSLAVFYTTITRWIIMALVILIIVRTVRSLLTNKSPSEVWAHLAIPGNNYIPLTHWENVIGRAKSSDVVLDVVSVSRNHGLLMRQQDGTWEYRDIGSKGGSKLNGTVIRRKTKVSAGDVITIGGLDCRLIPASLQEKLQNLEKREVGKSLLSPWTSLIILTIIQVLMSVQFIIAGGSETLITIPMTFGCFTILMWAYCIFLRSMKNTAFEVEVIAFFLCTLNLAVVSTSAPEEIGKQFMAIVMGLGLYTGMCWFLRDLDRALKIRVYLVGISIVLLIINLVFGTLAYGATNWVSIGGITIQPSELVKIAFIFVGSAAMDELYQKKNLTIFLGFSLFCFGALAIMGDFGTALIFFVTFLVISFLRSGEFSKLFLMIGTAAIGGLLVLRFRPYVADRFLTWGNAWSVPDAGGYQQTRTMTATASGGLPGIGGGEGWLHNIAAADTDLVFGIISEEWGLIVGLMAITCIISLALFAFKSIQVGRSSFFTIAACGTTTLLIFQTTLNVFGALDILPLTGVTFPFVSNGGTSMLASWGLLAFIKAADTRASASIAVKSMKKDEVEGGLL